MSDLHARVDWWKEAVDGRLLGAIHIISMDDITAHQNAINANNVFTLGLAIRGSVESVELPLKHQYGSEALLTSKSIW